MIRVEVIEERHKTNIHDVYIYLLGNIYMRHVYRENSNLTLIHHDFDNFGETHPDVHYYSY